MEWEENENEHDMDHLAHIVFSIANPRHCFIIKCNVNHYYRF